MTKEEAITKYIVPAIEKTWNDKRCKEILEALEQEPCEDAISREELLKSIDTWDRFGVDDTNSLFRLDNLSLPHYVPYIHYDDVVKCIKGMPPVNPQEPKTGHWIEVIDEVNEYGNKTYHHECSECGSNKSGWGEYNFCPNCGAKMVEPQETETWNGYHGQITAPKGTFERIFNDADDDSDI